MKLYVICHQTELEDDSHTLDPKQYPIYRFILNANTNIKTCASTTKMSVFRVGKGTVA